MSIWILIKKCRVDEAHAWLERHSPEDLSYHARYTASFEKHMGMDEIAGMYLFTDPSRAALFKLMFG